MCIYPAQLGIMTPGGLQPIAPCLPRAIISILSLGSQGSDCRCFFFSHAPILTIGSTAGQLVGC